MAKKPKPKTSVTHWSTRLGFATCDSVADPGPSAHTDDIELVTCLACLRGLSADQIAHVRLMPLGLAPTDFYWDNVSGFEGFGEFCRLLMRIDDKDFKTILRWPVVTKRKFVRLPSFRPLPKKAE